MVVYELRHSVEGGLGEVRVSDSEVACRFEFADCVLGGLKFPGNVARISILVGRHLVHLVQQAVSLIWTIPTTFAEL